MDPKTAGGVVVKMISPSDNVTSKSGRPRMEDTNSFNTRKGGDLTAARKKAAY